ncbi:MAG: hypothetical protein SGJ18_06335 [Pseudomonadota bacterium]|nr:hypothetical protein [Pseudomonadota bacterium]
MDTNKSESLEDVCHLRAADREVFIDRARDFFRENAEEYRCQHTIFMFSMVEGVYKFTHKTSFDSEESANKFWTTLDESKCFIHLGKLKGEFYFYFAGKDFAGIENFDVDYGKISDYLDANGEVITTPPKNLWEVFIRKAVEQYVADTKPKKRKLVS